jgi:hypothetical protein
MPGAGFAVTWDARHDSRYVVRGLNARDKALANRRNRHQWRRELRTKGEDADLTPKLWTGWDVA